MKKIKLAAVLISFLLFLLSLEGGSLLAKLTSSNFQMSSDVICATGGGSQSASFTLKVSVGGQGSPVGTQSSENYSGGGGWIYTTEEEGTRGDVNNDGIINVGDVVYLVGYLYRNGLPPDPLWVGDANSDDIVNIGDVVYLVSYLYRGGPPPCSPGGGQEILASVLRSSGRAGHAQISLALETDPTNENSSGFGKISAQGWGEVSEISVKGKFDRIVAGIELEIEFNPEEVTLLDPTLSPLTGGLQLFAGIKDGTQKIGIVDLSGSNFLPPGEGALVYLRAKGKDLTSIRIKKATLVDRDAMPFDLELYGELSQGMVQGSQSRPDRFSLSQNYPNPFNPQTNIEYALPQDAHVSLTVYNVLGRKVTTLVDEDQSAGYNTVMWDGKDDKGEEVASGVYFYKLKAGEFSEIKKMMMLK